MDGLFLGSPRAEERCWDRSCQLWRLSARGSCSGNKPKAGWSSKQSSEVQLSQEKVGYGEGKLKISAGHGAISTHHVH